MAKTVFSDTPPQGTVVTAAFLNAVNSHRHTGENADGAGALDYAVATGSSNAYAITLTPALTAHIPGMPITMKANHTNTGAATVAVNGMAAVTIKRRDGSSLAAGDILSGAIVALSYDGTNYQLISQDQGAALPVGEIAFFAMSTAPTGWLKANGAAVSRTTYADLYSAIGTTFGAGDGSTTFNLPDLRGEFIRGWDDSRGVDSGRTFGSAQADDFKSHAHDLPADAVASADMQSLMTSPSSDEGWTGTHLTAYTGGAETRPRNIALLACILYKK